MGRQRELPMQRHTPLYRRAARTEDRSIACACSAERSTEKTCLFSRDAATCKIRSQTRRRRNDESEAFRAMATLQFGKRPCPLPPSPRLDVRTWHVPQDVVLTGAPGVPPVSREGTVSAARRSGSVEAIDVPIRRGWRSQLARGRRLLPITVHQVRIAVQARFEKRRLPARRGLVAEIRLAEDACPGASGVVHDTSIDAVVESPAMRTALRSTHESAHRARPGDVTDRVHLEQERIDAGAEDASSLRGGVEVRVLRVAIDNLHSIAGFSEHADPCLAHEAAGRRVPPRFLAFPWGGIERLHGSVQSARLR